MRAAVLVAGAGLLEALLSGLGRSVEGGVECLCGARMQSQGVRGKRLLTILGEVKFSRTRYQCPVCGESRYPGDEELDVAGTGRSPGLRRMMARAGSKGTFKEGSEDLRIYAGVQVSAKDVERVAEKIGREVEAWQAGERALALAGGVESTVGEAVPVMYIAYDGTGVPMVPWEVAGRKGKQADGSAKTREAKLGCVFTQTATDEKGFPLRDADSTSFVGAIEGAEKFGERIYAEAARRGLNQAQKVVVLGDGARWVRGLAELHFWGATQIIDLYHAREHIGKLCQLLFAGDEKKIRAFRMRWWTLLDEGKVERIVAQARSQLTDAGANQEQIETELGYFEENRERMRYQKFREEGLFVGSGVVEAGCKSVIGQRLKRSGMEWSVAGANAIIGLRCLLLSGRFEEYWESRCA